MLQSGDKAPDFTAVTANGNTISLHDYLGRNNVVLFFYPKDDTSGCTREVCEFRDAQPNFADADAVVLGVSTDDQSSHAAFSSKYSLNFPLLVDSDEKICEAYGVGRRNGEAHRVTFLIDIDGVIRHVWEKVSVDGHAADVYEQIAALG